MSVGNLKALYNSSDSIAKLNHQRYEDVCISQVILPIASGSRNSLSTQKRTQKSDTKKQSMRLMALRFEVIKSLGADCKLTGMVGLAAETLDDSEMEYCQTHLRILSGLYGASNAQLD